MNKNFKNMIIVFAGFFFLSLFSNTVSPFITTIKNTYNVSADVIAILPPVIYFASFMMSIIGAKLMSVLGLKKGLYLGLLFAIFASIIIIFSRSFYILLFGYFISGLSVGMSGLFLGTILSVLPAEYQKFSLANACYGLGGILILPIDRFILKSGISFNYTYTIHVVVIALFIIFATKIDLTSSFKNNYQSKVSFDILKNPLVLLLSIAIFFYVGAEISTTNWTGSFLEKYYGVSKEEVPNILSSFWILFTIGRAVGDKLLEKVGRLQFLLVAPILSVIGIFIILFGTDKVHALVGLSVIGISISVIYPALQGFIVQNVDKRSVPSASAVIIIFNNLGATFLTYIIGFAGGIKITYVFIIQILFYLYIVLVSARYLTFKTKKQLS
ncbi:MFS transporter [Clostridium magnum]|uniref:Protein TsgA n=1 Tax=Clostridium magnum DSM 2767 TaxID=1121326 RepID=A0A162SK43_9CLOT|nr:MFS transporter [Clostridium magnum]KZL91383.1 protein TsgA [Clostridium magnum DSM 2767]SHH40372.1 Fucose permease [Clostridium magnum DSM 2767]